MLNHTTDRKGHGASSSHRKTGPDYSPGQPIHQPPFHDWTIDYCYWSLLHSAILHSGAALGTQMFLVQDHRIFDVHVRSSPFFLLFLSLFFFFVACIQCMLGTSIYGLIQRTFVDSKQNLTPGKSWGRHKPSTMVTHPCGGHTPLCLTRFLRAHALAL